MGIALIIGLGLVAALLAGAGHAATPTGRALSDALDPGIPEPLRSAIVGLLARGTDPLQLEQTAIACDQAGYARAAAMLRARAAQLRGTAPQPGGLAPPRVTVPTGPSSSPPSMPNLPIPPIVPPGGVPEVQTDTKARTEAAMKEVEDLLKQAQKIPQNAPPAVPLPLPQLQIPPGKPRS